MSDAKSSRAEQRFSCSCLICSPLQRASVITQASAVQAQVSVTITGISSTGGATFTIDARSNATTAITRAITECLYR